MITLTVEAAARTLEVEFVVIDAKSAYNVIMGRGWIHEMEGVASILHQVMRCLSPDRTKTIDIRGYLSTAQRCYNIAICEESNPKGKHKIRRKPIAIKGGPTRNHKKRVRKKKVRWWKKQWRF